MSAPTLSLTFEELDPWALACLLQLLSETATRHGVRTLTASCELTVRVEVTEEGDIAAFERELNAQWIFFGKGES